jgi:hypothetical protein
MTKPRATERIVRAISFGLALLGCEAPAAEPAPIAEAVAPDRLTKEETLPGRSKVFGIEVPQGLSVAAEFDNVAHLTGHVKVEAVLGALRKQLVTSHVELGNQRATIPSAYVKDDASKRVYRVEIVSERGVTNVRIQDITPPPVAEGLNEEERWERAGRNPDGTIKDRLKVY